MAAEVTVRAPGRINIVGEHTDYNKGLVLPAAINRYVEVKASTRGTMTASSSYISSALFDDGFEWQPRRSESGWRSYVASVLDELTNLGIDASGITLSIRGNLPAGRGLGSSGALEVAVALAVLRLRRVRLPRMQLAALCLHAENYGVGVNSEIMDQFISLFGQRNKAVWLDTKTMSYQYLQLPKDCAFVLLDPGKARALADSAFNERRHECNMALTAVRNLVPAVQDLSDLDSRDLWEVAPHLEEPLQSRVRHIVTENERVRIAVQAIQQHDLDALCQIMYESHRSLSEDYRTSAPELDAIVSTLKRSGLPVGAKLCGAGFGGAVVCCVIRPDTALLRKVASTASDSVGAPVVMTPVRVVGSARLIPSRS